MFGQAEGHAVFQCRSSKGAYCGSYCRAPLSVASGQAKSLLSNGLQRPRTRRVWVGRVCVAPMGVVAEPHQCDEVKPSFASAQV